MLGAVGFASSIPVLLFSLFGGVLADRIERRRLMVGTQTASMILAFVLAFLTLSGAVTVWHIMTIALPQRRRRTRSTRRSASRSSPTWSSKEDLQNAIAINSTQFQISRTLGPALAGLTLAAVGPGWCFFLNAMLVPGRDLDADGDGRPAAAARGGSRRSAASARGCATCAAKQTISRCCSWRGSRACS